MENRASRQHPCIATRDQVLGFRLAHQHLATRLPPGALIEAARYGIQNTPPGTAALALHARVKDMSPADLDRALAIDKTLFQVWSVRAAPYVVPTRDAVVFTSGLLPESEETLRFFLRGAVSHLELFGLSATELVERTAVALIGVLDGRELTKDELGVALAQQLTQYITPQKIKLLLAIEMFSSIPRGGFTQIESEAATLAPFKGSDLVEIVFVKA